MNEYNVKYSQPDNRKMYVKLVTFKGQINCGNFAKRFVIMQKQLNNGANKDYYSVHMDICIVSLPKMH